MKVAVDIHVHFYPCYDRDFFFESLLTNMEAHKADFRCIFMAETGSFQYYKEWVKDGLAMLKVDARETSDHSCLKIVGYGTDLFLFPARQIVTEEGVEIIGLFARDVIEDGLSILEVIKRLKNQNKIPVILWAPGKWIGKRKLQMKLMNKINQDNVFFGESSLKPRLFPSPVLMRAKRRKFVILYGSDPLPVKGEERYAGSFVSMFNAEFDCLKPEKSLRELLEKRLIPKPSGGHFSPVLPFCRLLFHILKNKCFKK